MKLNIYIYHTCAFTENCPKHIENLKQVFNQIENDKNYVIVIGGNNRSNQINGNAGARENNRATSKDNLSRIDLEMGYKM
ncbi:Uncharacterised protein [Bacillus tequilensis]|nr:Uncharacterised protein [Bacillus tequilensis]